VETLSRYSFNRPDPFSDLHFSLACPTDSTPATVFRANQQLVASATLPTSNGSHSGLPCACLADSIPGFMFVILKVYINVIRDFKVSYYNKLLDCLVESAYVALKVYIKLIRDFKGT
jgi:hypothetical protein